MKLRVAMQRSRTRLGLTYRLGLVVVCLGILLSLSTTLAWAQSTSTGTVSGQVVDQTNAAVPGAEVTLLDVAKGTSQKIVTNEEGRYSFINVSPGLYDIAVSKSGFKLTKIPSAKVSVGLVLTINVALKDGPVSKTTDVAS